MKKIKSMIDIAKIAGVSEGTVSRALKDSPLISKQVKEKIQEIARINHYSVNRNASSLSTQKSDAIVVVVNQDLRAKSFSGHPFILSMLGLLADELAKQNLEMILSPDRDITGCWNNHYIRSKRADGIIILGPGPDATLFDELTKHKVSFVVWGGKEEHQKHCVVAGDNRKGGYLVVEHLIRKCSRKRILLLGPRYTLEGSLRFQGYKRGLQDFDGFSSKDLLIECEWSMQSAYSVVMELLESNTIEFNAIFGLNDMIAFGAIKAIQDFGMNVPQDISVVGYDDIPASQLITPALTSVRQDPVEAAHLLVENILALTRGKKPKCITLDTELVVRGSTTNS